TGLRPWHSEFETQLDIPFIHFLLKPNVSFYYFFINANCRRKNPDDQKSLPQYIFLNHSNSFFTSRLVFVFPAFGWYAFILGLTPEVFSVFFDKQLNP
ncbi:MAG: hypothetical protein KAS98_02070, partial [Deltaproteobacteria bacterium]|nr:hypothetical protein [Deltaproteobacteria bacterium]